MRKDEIYLRGGDEIADLKELGLYLKTLRLQNRYGTQAEAAKKIGVSRYTVIRWEAGEAAPSLENLIAIGQAYGTDSRVLAAKAGLDTSGYDYNEVAAFIQQKERTLPEHQRRKFREAVMKNAEITATLLTPAP